MQGPYRIGSQGSPVTPAQGDWERTRLVRGERYRVIKMFRDADGDEHPIGEEWKIPLIWKPDRHMDVIENWQLFLAAT